MKHKKINLVSQDGVFLTGRFWRPKESPHAAICLVHGIGEHSGRYDAWARRFCARGYVVYAVDLRGHGLSEGKRGHVHQFHDFMYDIDALVKRSHREQERLPVFIYGHSMGGTLVLNFLIQKRQDFKGAVVSAPWLKLVKPPHPGIRKMGKALGKVFPRLTLRTGIDSAQLTSDVRQQEESDQDELMHGKISLRLFNEIDRVSAEVLEESDQIDIPVFLAHGDDDELTDSGITRQFAQAIGPKALFYSVKGARHEIHREPGADELFDQLVQWMEDNIKGVAHE
jgi:alpha-beta hydrolase superfamily lysophospholipase